MKILVIQLARLGDIFQTLPSLHALKRENPTAEVHLMVRDKFKAATFGARVDRIIPFASQDVLQPLFEEDQNLMSVLKNMDQVIQILQGVGYDRIINATFSPFSSYLTAAIKGPQTSVQGYTRHADGYLDLPDETSAYFYSQVGVGRANRAHLVDLMAALCMVDLKPEDFELKDVAQPNAEITSAIASANVTVHIGASQKNKTLSTSRWMSLLSQFIRRSHARVNLIGSAAETEMVEQMMASLPTGSVNNLVGKTSLEDLYHILKGSKMLIGGDSGPLQMTLFTDTKSFNISFATVNFWETGPRIIGSKVIYIEDENDIASDELALLATQTLNDEPTFNLRAFNVVHGVPGFDTKTDDSSEFQWQFIRALYMDGEFPLPDTDLIIQGLVKLEDVNNLVIEQIQKIQKGVNVEHLSGILDRCEEIFKAIVKLVPEMGVMVRWYETQKIRQGVLDQQVLIANYLKIHLNLKTVLDVYLDIDKENTQAAEGTI